jgi:hypothetical protein
VVKAYCSGAGPISAASLRERPKQEDLMRRILLIALLAAFASATTMPSLVTVLGFDQTAYAQKKPPKPIKCPVDQDGNDDCQGNEG